MSTLWLDIRFAFRNLSKNAAFAALAVLILALGVGANTAIFSLVNALLLRPLPYPEAQRVVKVMAAYPGTTADPVSAPNFRDWRDQSTDVFEAMAAYDILPSGMNYAGEGLPERVSALHVTASFFRAVGVAPQQGRDFLPDEDQAGRAPVVVVSERFRQRHFAKDEIVGKTIRLNGVPTTVIGVMPAGFSFLPEADLWTQMVLETTSMDRSANVLQALGRIRRGVSLAQAQSAMTVVATRLREQYPENNKDRGIALVPLQKRLARDVQPALLVLLGAVLLVLLIACANVASLLLAQASGRRREIAIRTALGASRGRIARQLFTESVLLALLGAAAGVAMAHWLVRGLLAIVPADLPLMNGVALDLRVLGFALAVATITGALFGMAPTLQLWRVDVNSTLKEGSRDSGRTGLRFRNLLMVAEVALAMVLSAGAGLLIASFQHLQQANPGVEPRGVLSLRLPLAEGKYASGADIATYWRKLLAPLASVPGAESVSAATSLPFEVTPDFPFQIAGKPAARPEDTLSALYVAVAPNYFRTLGTPLRSGRDFTDADNEAAAPVVMINERAARQWWPKENPIGQMIWLGKGMGPQFAETRPRQIVGVVGDIFQQGDRSQPDPAMYLPLAQMPAGITPLLTRLLPLGVVLRTSGNPLALAKTAQDQIWSVAAEQPVTKVLSLEQVATQSLDNERFLLLLVTGFGGLAVMLAAAGIYGLMSYSVAQRRHEFGIRMAIGATPSRVRRVVLGQAVRLALVGIGAGAAGALGLARLMVTLLFGVRSWEPGVFAAVAAVLLAVAAAAAYEPAARATRVDPIVVLRYE